MKSFILLLKKALRPKGKDAFLMSLPKDSTILDVGCGNNSPYRTKKILPHCSYTGVDVGDYNQSRPNIADEYIVTTPEDFAKTIMSLPSKYDAAICSHNLEHCDDREATLLSMLNALRSGGTIYISFPCEQSVAFPKRLGTLNYFDDVTHQFLPPSFSRTCELISRSGFRIDYAIKNYQPMALWFVGMLNEPISKIRCKVSVGTWEYYGFETIIVATKTT